MSACPACAKDVDPLRAGHVAIFAERFFYFCDRACRERIAPLSASAFADSASRSPPVHASSPPAASSSSNGFARHAERISLTARDEPAPSPIDPPVSLRTIVREAEKAEAPREVGAALAWTSVSMGVLAIAFVLAGSAPWVMAVRVACAWLAWACIAARGVYMRHEPTDAPAAFLLGPGLAACVVATAAWLADDRATQEAATFAGIVVATAAVAMQLVEKARQPTRAERMRIAEALASAGALQLKAGEELVLSAGEASPVDGTIVGGSAVVVPWLGAAESVKRKEGDSILSGAKITAGEVRVRASYAGLDRAWARLTLDPRRRADVHARIARIARAFAGRGGAVALLLGTLAGIANGESIAHIALTAIAAWAAVGTAAVASMPAVHVARGVLEGLRRGIAYRSPADWDRAGDVSIAAFCARGTLLLGEPELADLEAVGKTSEEQVLALAAGAESLSTHPVAMAIQRAANARRIRPDAVRSPSMQPGLGVAAVASTGESLTVGSRALMLKEKISVAIAEQKIAEIEAHGREVLLVALAGRLIGVLGLQDGLRPGARAAVQHLLDAQVEPVLVSGDSRETCEAIGRALDIDHVRAEIPLAERAAEVERLAQGGLTVAVLGHPRTDEAALSAAHVAVAMPAGSASGEWGVMLASDDVRDGALSISLARRTKNEARTGLILAVAPGAFLGLAVLFGLLPAAYAPLAALLGASACALHARATDLTRGGAAQLPGKSNESPPARSRRAPPTDAIAVDQVD